MKFRHLIGLTFASFLIIAGMTVFGTIKPNLFQLPKADPTVLGAEDQPGDYVPAERTKDLGCHLHDRLPDPSCTPGAVLADISKSEICVPGYSKNIRNVTEAVKNQVFAEYGLSSHTQGEYEVDHLISLELGGSNDLANLWPEPALPEPGYHQKDIVENFLHEQVCNGRVNLSEAQKNIAVNWLNVFYQMRD